MGAGAIWFWGRNSSGTVLFSPAGQVHTMERLGGKRQLWRYTAAVLAMAAIALFRVATVFPLQTQRPVALIFLAALGIAWYLGRGPTIAATAVGAVGIHFVYAQPLPVPAPTAAMEAITIATYSGLCVAAALLVDSLRRGRRSETALNERLRFHLENSPLAVMEFDERFRVVRWPASAQRVFGWTAQEALGKSALEIGIVHPDDAAMVSEVFAGLASGRVLRQVNRNRNFHKDGTLLYCEWYNSALHDGAGRAISIFSMALDVTTRTAAEERNLQLLAQERDARAEAEVQRRFSQELLDSIRDGFVRFDRAWRFTYANDQALELLGRSRDELLGNCVWDVFPGFCGSEFERRFLDAAGRQVYVQFETIYSPANRWYSLHVYPGAGGVSVHVSDVTERRQMEERLGYTARLESLGILAGGVAHDFNNLLVGIMGNASLLQEYVPPGSNPRRWADEVISASERAAELTRLMLAYAGKGPVHHEYLDMTAEVRALEALLRSTIPPHVRLDLRLTDDLPPVAADHGQLQQIVLNLVLNGAEAIVPPAGCVTVSTMVQEFDAPVLLQALGYHDLRPGRYVVLEVRDTGCGMDEQTRARVFDPFYTTKFMGRGLGLAAVLGIVRAHRGGIAVRSTPGAGSSFLVLLPAAAIG
jgi:PAS domain S-box-containing protein